MALSLRAAKKMVRRPDMGNIVTVKYDGTVTEVRVAHEGQAATGWAYRHPNDAQDPTVGMHYAYNRATGELARHLVEAHRAQATERREAVVSALDDVEHFTGLVHNCVTKCPNAKRKGCLILSYRRDRLSEALADVVEWAKRQAEGGHAA